MSSMTETTKVRQPAVAGIDTHKDSHHVAVIDPEGRLLADCRFETTTAGLTRLLGWLSRWRIEQVGVEQTGTYGAELTRRLTKAGYRVAEVNQPDVIVRASAGKSDPIDALAPAQAARTGRATVTPKDRTGVVEAVRVLFAARDLAVKARSEALNQFDGLRIAAPAALRQRLAGTIRHGVNEALRLRPDLTRINELEQATKYALRSIASRIRDLDDEIAGLDKALARVVSPIAPRLLARPQVGIITAAQLLTCLGQDPDRVSTDAKFARLAGIAPIPASSGKTNRMRLHRGGNRQANKTIHMVCVGRLANHQPAIDYLVRRCGEGLSRTDALRAMKRLVARELYGALKADLKALRQGLDEL